MRFYALCLAGLALAASAHAAPPAAMSVQVRNGQLRATASFLGAVVAPLAYGDRVQVVGEQGPWMQVKTAAGQAGWVHSSALTPKRIAMSAGSGNAAAGASGEELALASKGFNSDVEAEFKAQNKDVDFTWVDRMEKMKVPPGEMRVFLKEGGVAPAGGGQ